MIEVDDLLVTLEQQLSRYQLIPSLYVFYSYIQYLQFNMAMPKTIQLDPMVAAAEGYDRNYYEWEIDLLVRQLLIHHTVTGNFSLDRWSEFAATVNALKALDDQISKRSGDTLKDNMLLELGRLAYRQFPWQEHPNHWQLVRYYKIFSDPAISAIMEAEIGLSAKELYLLGLAMTGHFLTKFAYSFPIDLSPIGISEEKFKRFLKHFAAPISELIKMAAASEFRNENFSYSQNPLRIFPIMRTGIGGRHTLIAPIPSHLFHRISSGVYYELVHNDGFGAVFGPSFQRYVGEVLTAALPKDRFSVLPEAEYHVGKNREDSVDWIASDGSAHLFVECKTKRMQLNSKIALADTAALQADISKVADFAVQLYKTMDDAKVGRYPHWKADEKQLYPVIVLLEEWYLFDPRLEEEIEKRISVKLAAQGIDPTVVKECPFSICSAGDFEVLTQVIAMTSIAKVMEKRRALARTKWNMKAFLFSEFGGEVAKIGKAGLFPDELNSLHPAITHPGSDKKTPE